MRWGGYFLRGLIDRLTGIDPATANAPRGSCQMIRLRIDEESCSNPMTATRTTRMIAAA